MPVNGSNGQHVLSLTEQLIKDAIGDKEMVGMHNEFTAVIERDDEWFIAYSPEVPGANGQGRSKQECLQSLADSIALIREDRREDSVRELPENAFLELVSVG